MLTATIERFAPPGSRYLESCHKTIGKYDETSGYALQILVGLLKALKNDYSKGYLSSVRELIHADVFADFLEMSDYLVGSGYKDAAAVICGGVLEEQLRQLCSKNSINTKEKGRQKKADRMNADLKKVYGSTDHKNVTAWLNIRNDAAHGHYRNYKRSQVVLMIKGVRDFIVRNPA